MDFLYAIVDINKDQPNEESKCYSELAGGVSFCFGKGVVKAYSGIKERLQVSPLWKLLACTSCR